MSPKKCEELRSEPGAKNPIPGFELQSLFVLDHCLRDTDIRANLADTHYFELSLPAAP